MLSAVSVGFSQEQPAHWKISSQKLSDNEYKIIFQVSIDNPWHIYSINQKADDGPMPTAIKIKKSKDYEAIGEVTQSKPIKEFDKVFQVNVEYFSGKAEFYQKIKILKNGKVVIKGTYEYQACTEEKCVFPPSEPFEVVINAEISQANTATTIVSQQDSVHQKDSANHTVQQVIGKDTTSIITKSTTTKPSSEKDLSKLSAWSIFIEGFLGGLLALLTPCVFPMIPMNISFFTKRHKDRKKGIREAMLYAASIIVIYVALGILVTLIFGASALNDLSTNVWFNLFFFLLLMIFGFSFLGAFEINLPSSMVNKMDNLSSKGGFLGIFFMAFTLSLVSFSCTGPIVGTLLVQAASTGELLNPTLGMLGFSTALALPFGLFAAFPSWMQSMPKSDSWLNAVKVTLGFLEIALAFKFASNADLVVQAFILTREVFLAIWIAIFLLLTLYLLGFFKTHHDGETKYLSVPRIMFAILSLSITLYLVPGLWGAPLNLMSGVLPPLEYSEAPHGFGGSESNNTTTVNQTLTPEMEVNKHGIAHFKNNYKAALEYAKKVNKPLMVDFTGHACANCRKTEDFIWPDEQVKNILNNDVVLVSLYVDDKRELPENEFFEVEWYGKKREITTIGDKFKYLEETKYGQSTQPLYVLLNHQEQLVNSIRGYNSDKEEYINWLKEGIRNFKDGKSFNSK